MKVYVISLIVKVNCIIGGQVMKVCIDGTTYRPMGAIGPLGFQILLKNNLSSLIYVFLGLKIRIDTSFRIWSSRMRNLGSVPEGVCIKSHIGYVLGKIRLISDLREFQL